MLELIFFVSALVFLHIAFKMICFTVYLKKAYGNNWLTVIYRKADEDKDKAKTITILKIHYPYLYLATSLLTWWALMIFAYLGKVWL